MDAYFFVDFINNNINISAKVLSETDVIFSTVDIIYSCFNDKENFPPKIQIKYFHLDEYACTANDLMTIRNFLEKHVKNEKIIKIYTFNNIHSNDILYRAYSDPNYSFYKIDYNEIKKYISYYQTDFMKYYLNDHDANNNNNLVDSIKNMSELHIHLNSNNKRKLKLEKDASSNKKYGNVLSDDDILNDYCPVCTEKYIDNIDNICCLLCNHLVCFECIKKIEKDECPICREQYKKSLIKPNKHLINIIKKDVVFIGYNTYNKNTKELNSINEKITIINDIIKNRKVSILKNKKYLKCISKEINFWNDIDENSEMNYKIINLNFKKRKNIKIDSKKEKKPKI